MTGRRPVVPDANRSQPPDVVGPWHPPLECIKADELSAATATTPGMTRLEAISGKKTGSERIWLGLNHVEPGVRTADHDHGDSETGIYVVSGHPLFVFCRG
jgi:uncharacterized RmlC-like cupin family protein